MEAGAQAQVPSSPKKKTSCRKSFFMNGLCGCVFVQCKDEGQQQC